MIGKSKYLVITYDILLPVMICLGVVALLYFVLFSSFFAVTSIHCVLDLEPCEDPSLLSELDKLKGQNIFKIVGDQVTTHLTSLDFTIREATLSKELPGSISLSLQSVYPVVALQVSGDDPTWIIFDSTLRVIGARRIDPNVPSVVVQGPLTFTVGKVPTDANIISSLELAKRVSDELFAVKTITLIDADTIHLALDSGKIAIFTPKKDELVQLRALQTILTDATILEGVNTIDVRFARPVLR